MWCHNRGPVSMLYIFNTNAEGKHSMLSAILWDFIYIYISVHS